MQTCKRCIARPSGQDGHESLTTTGTGLSREVHFDCSECDCRWQRYRFRHDRFCWTLQVTTGGMERGKLPEHS